MNRNYNAPARNYRNDFNRRNAYDFGAARRPARDAMQNMREMVEWTLDANDRRNGFTADAQIEAIELIRRTTNLADNCWIDVVDKVWEDFGDGFGRFTYIKFAVYPRTIPFESPDDMPEEERALLCALVAKLDVLKQKEAHVKPKFYQLRLRPRVRR